MSGKAKITTLLATLAALAWLVYAGNDILIMLESEAPSQSIGATNNGGLVNGKRLPSSGSNFHSYSRLGSLLGRTAVHDRIRSTLLDAYNRLEQVHPELVFVYGETGWPQGGRFRPHRTHQNGLSVDFMVPVRKQGTSVRLPTHPFNKFGYALAFDSQGRSGDLEIDFKAIAAHLRALIAAGKAHGVSIDLVVFAPDLQRHLFEDDTGADLRGKLRFNMKPSWVRHDDHYHIDFRLTGTTGS